MTGPRPHKLGGSRELESGLSDPQLAPFPSTGEDSEGVNNFISFTKRKEKKSYSIIKKVFGNKLSVKDLLLGLFAKLSAL